MTSSRGGALVKMMTEGVLSYRNSAGIVVCLYLCMISKACALYHNLDHINLIF